MIRQLLVKKQKLLVCRSKEVLLCLLLLFSTTAFGKIEVYFSPSTDCEDKLVDLINNSTETIDVAVYSINNDNIVNALKKAQDRGVRMRVLTDRTQASGKSSKVRELYDSGVNIKVHSKHKIEHNKFAIFDGKMASTGSYNWTNPASNKNSENCVFFIEEQEVIAKYQERFDYLWEINTKNASDTWFNKVSK